MNGARRAITDPGRPNERVVSGMTSRYAVGSPYRLVPVALSTRQCRAVPGSVRWAVSVVSGVRA
jgi:hypothetical protein